jgi:DNA-binding NtrC family response regulator
MLAAFSSHPFGATNPRDETAPLFSAKEKSRPTILLVDDDSSVRNGICRVLSAEALNVAPARGVKDALNHISWNTPDLVLTDLCMAPLTGRDLIIHLGNNYPTLPIFVITALAKQSLGGVDRAVCGFFRKPLDFDMLLRAIWHRLGQRGFNLNPSIAQP